VEQGDSVESVLDGVLVTELLVAAVALIDRVEQDLDVGPGVTRRL
jgi:hypothetical protein